MTNVAIDLGTTNSQIGALVAGEPHLVEVEGRPSVPSIAYVEPEAGRLWVGRHAEDCWADPLYDVLHSFRRWKLRMGQETPIRRLSIGRGATYLDVTPGMLASEMVRYLLGAATEGVGGLRVQSVVATVPHGWRRNHPERCAATRDSLQSGARQFDVGVRETTLSEPVAAAAYWLWAASRRMEAEALRGRTILVCDMGGGTFDLSFVRISEDLESLDVIDATNHEVAGDWADALICRAIGQAAGVEGLPTTPDEILSRLDDPSLPWLREWFRAASGLKTALSAAAVRQREGSRMARHSVQVTTPRGEAFRFALDVQELKCLLEPFYEQGRHLVRSFLDALRVQDPVSATTFAGGGGRILGMSDQIVAPVLAERMGKEEAVRMMQRLSVNPAEIDKAVVKGAVLIANDAIRISERLLYNVGIVAQVDPATAEALGISVSGDRRVLVAPVLQKGSSLPARFESSAILGNAFMAAAPRVEIVVVLDDGGPRRSTLRWEIENPDANQRSSRLHWSLAVDLNGILALELKPEGGRPPLRVEAPLGHAKPLALPPGSHAGVPVVSPEAFRSTVRSHPTQVRRP